MIILELKRKSGKEIIRLETSEWKGKKNVNFRLWYLDENEEVAVFKPTSKGVVLFPDEIDKIIEAFQKAKEDLGGE